MNGDEALGAFVLDRLQAQIEIWRLFLADIPTFVVNTTHGRDLIHDAMWYASENPDFLTEKKREKSSADLMKLLEKEYGIRYDGDGNWEPTA